MAVPTTGTRQFIGPQLAVVQLAYVAAVTVILLAELRTPRLPGELLAVWIVESMANLVVRVALYIKMLSFTPKVFAASVGWRLVPAINATMVGCHWAWTAWLFVGPTLTFTSVVTLMAFLLMSIASMAAAAASPVAAVVYILFLWVPMSIQLFRTEGVDFGAFAILLAGVAATLGTGFFVVLSQVRRFLVKSDEVDMLISELRDANDRLEAMRTAATTELEARSQFFNGASHDFGQRLHAIKLLAHTARSTAVTAEPVSHLSRLSAAIEDLESYIHGLLDYARYEGSTISTNRERFDLQDVFQKLDVQFEDVAMEAGKSVRFRTTELQVVTDQAMLTRILQNLVANAIKFTRCGVLVAARRRGSTCLIEVWDQGEGIAPGKEEAIFQPFYQQQATGNSERRGVGLGLAVVRRLADSLGINVEVRSAPKHGSMFRIVVPDPVVVASTTR